MSIVDASSMRIGDDVFGRMPINEQGLSFLKGLAQNISY